MSTPSIPTRHHRGLDLVLVLAAISSLILVHIRAVNLSHVSHAAARDPLPWALAIPVIYVLLSSFLARAGLATVGRRGYVLSCLGGLCGVGYVAMTTLGDLEKTLAAATLAASGTEAVADRSLDLAASGSLVLGLLHDTATHFLYPIIAGIALYTVCSVFESDDAAGEENYFSAAARFDFERVSQWLDAANVPQSLRMFIDELGKQMAELGEAYRQLTERARGANDEVRLTAAAVGELRDVVEEIGASGLMFAADMRKLSEGLADFRQELSGANAEGERLTKAVGQIRQVMDEFAELASEEILNLAPRSVAERR
jgi:hypothetical protein